jgi:hypothetical protein
VGAKRLLWGADITLCTGLAKLWALDVIGLTSEEMTDVRWRNAMRIFPRLEWAPITGNRESGIGNRQQTHPEVIPIPDSHLPAFGGRPPIPD